MIGHASPWRPGRREREQASGGLAGAEHTGWDRCDHSRRDVGWGRTRTGSGAGRCRPRATTRSASAPRPCQVPARPRRVVGAACPPSYQNLRRSICTSFFTCSRTAAGALAAGEADQSGGIGISVNSWGERTSHAQNNVHTTTAITTTPDNTHEKFRACVGRGLTAAGDGVRRWLGMPPVPCATVAAATRRSKPPRCQRLSAPVSACLSAPVSACQRHPN